MCLDLIDQAFAPLLPLGACWVQGLSFAAGAIITCAGIPKLRERLADFQDGTARFSSGDLWRDALVALGNAVWVAMGLASGIVSITLFCAIQVVVMAALIRLNLRTRPAPPARALPG